MLSLPILIVLEDVAWGYLVIHDRNKFTDQKGQGEGGGGDGD